LEIEDVYSFSYPSRVNIYGAKRNKNVKEYSFPDPEEEANVTHLVKKVNELAGEKELVEVKAKRRIEAELMEKQDLMEEVHQLKSRLARLEEQNRALLEAN
jgi:hypothetical protein